MSRTFLTVVGLMVGLIFFAGSTASLAMEAPAEGQKSHKTKRSRAKPGKG